jgi:hypothetical protein
MRSVDEYPVVLRCDGLRARPSRVRLMANGLWQVDWIGGLVSVYRGDPRLHLQLGYEPKHLRWWHSRPGQAERAVSGPTVALGH